MPDSLQLIELHLADARIGGARPATVRAKNQVLRMLSVSIDHDLSEATRYDIVSFVARPGLAQNSRAIYLTHIRTFYRWAEREGLILEDPTRRLPGPKYLRGLPRPMPLEDYRRAVATARSPVKQWLLLGGLAGLRCCEMAELQGDDIELSDPPTIRVKGKGGKAGIIPMHPLLVTEVGRYAGRPEYVFPHQFRPGAHVLATSVSAAINEHLHEQGIKSTAHSTRHLFGTQTYRLSGRDLRLTQDLLRHSSPATTSVYTLVDPVESAKVVGRLDFF